MKKLVTLIGFVAFSASASGCVAIAAAGAGVMAHDEATEKDGEFDPLEKVFEPDEKDDN